VRKYYLACGLYLLLFGSGKAQRLDLIQEPCITGESCRCPCTREGKKCPCIKKCGPGDKIVNELVP
jgi:hypothetical protein